MTATYYTNTPLITQSISVYLQDPHLRAYLTRVFVNLQYRLEQPKKKPYVRPEIRRAKLVDLA